MGRMDLTHAPRRSPSATIPWKATPTGPPARASHPGRGAPFPPPPVESLKGSAGTTCRPRRRLRQPARAADFPLTAESSSTVGRTRRSPVCLAPASPEPTACAAPERPPRPAGPLALSPVTNSPPVAPVEVTKAMLVLSRRADEKVVLPTVPAVIKVISSQNGVVRLGIEAPSNVPILREELCRADRPEPPPAAPAVPAEPCPPRVRHVLRNRVNNLALGLTLLRMRLQGDGDPAVRKTLAGLEEELEALRQYVSAPPAAQEPDPARPHLARGTA